MSPFVLQSDCEVTDPRIRRTRQSLQGGLKELLLKVNFEQISVLDIAEAAGVNRATFYDHYSDKYALLEALVAGEFHKLLHERQVFYDGGCPSAARAILEATCEFLIKGNEGRGECRGQSAFEPLMDAAITAAIRRVLMRGGAELSSQSDLSLEMTATIASYAIYGAAKQWFLTPNRPELGLVVPQILQVILPMLPTRRLSSVSV